MQYGASDIPENPIQSEAQKNATPCYSSDMLFTYLRGLSYLPVALSTVHQSRFVGDSR
jgi:hypothetical protein